MNMSTPIEIRSITETDIDGFHACLDAVARERIFLGFVEAPSLEKTRKWIVSDLEAGEIRLVALDKHKVIGWCDIETSQREGFTHSGKLGMGIMKKYRGLGIGKRLMEETISVARSRGLERIELDVYASNTIAINLYEKFNFHTEGRKQKARKIDERYEDILNMALFLE